MLLGAGKCSRVTLIRGEENHYEKRYTTNRFSCVRVVVSSTLSRLIKSLPILLCLFLSALI